MNYLFTGIELQIDKGFGITADAYFKSAEHLLNNHFENYDSTQQAEMPQNYLYRHSIELYLKSLIIIFHRKLKLDFGTVLYDSEDPEVCIEGKWIKLYKCHFIDKLYGYWLNDLLLNKIELLKEIAPKGEWHETERITELFSLISKYDQDSSFFRYPITKNNSLDHKKYTMQKFKATNMKDYIKNIQKQNIPKKGTITMLLVDENDNIVDAFKQNKNVLSDVRDALKEIAFYFHCIHIMTRKTLCGGM
ncbi:MAG: hypothetical protein A2W91_09925 [Bacteroidetes bacterium GWF2_38_335]|nr:MAG: hypothetical protein A2W91_09925 [Bacteroidetes bacterium GWF2_38_335]HBS88055.1 hypothetical protein [Bacteroidales bacterium]